MASNVKVLILRTAGTNCDNETAFAFEKAGGSPEFVHINDFISKKKDMNSYQIMALPGGFSYGDDVASGKILANELRFELKKEVAKFIKSGKLIIGICNGFQVLVKAGLLPNGSGQAVQASLTLNDSGRFQDEWVYLKSHTSHATRHKCIWTQNLPETIYLPIAHGEGKFIPKDAKLLKKLYLNGQVVLQYVDNPNGSIDSIAGICDPTGRVFGLMPHPERHLSWEQHPNRSPVPSPQSQEGDGLQIFRNAVEYAKNNL